MAKLTAKQVEKYYKKEDIDSLFSILEVEKLNYDQLFSLRNEIIEILLEKDDYLFCLSWILRNLDPKIRAKEYENYIQKQQEGEKESLKATKKAVKNNSKKVKK